MDTQHIPAHYHYFGLHYCNGPALVTGISFDKRITDENSFNTSVIYFHVLSVSLSVTFTHDTIVSAQWFRHYFLRITNLTCHKATTSTRCYIQIWQTATSSWKQRALNADWLRHETIPKRRPPSAFQNFHQRKKWRYIKNLNKLRSQQRIFDKKVVIK